MLYIILLTITFNSINCMRVRMSDPSIRIYDNTNLTITCKTEQLPNSTADLSLSVRARMVLTLLPIPRSGPLHQVNGVLHCDPLRTSCESEFNIAVSCIKDRINISIPMDTIESACQLVDDQVCSHVWLQQHRGDCFALGSVTIIKGPKLGETCVSTNSSIEQLLPCAEYQYCDTKYGICQCQEHYIPMNSKCITNYHQSDSLNLFSSTTTTTQPSILPTLVSDNPQKKSNNKQTSKALVIFLLIVAILLCIALAVVVIWSYSRNRNRTVAVGSD